MATPWNADREIQDRLERFPLTRHGVSSNVQFMYKVEVIADSSGKWAGNGLTFETREAAREYGSGLFARWTAVREWRVVEIATGAISPMVED